MLPPFNPVLRAVARLANRRCSFRPSTENLWSHNQIRCFSSIVGTNVFSSADKLAARGCGNRNLLEYGNSAIICNADFQKRSFLGVVDESSEPVSKRHEEKLVLGYSPEQLFNVVAAVDLYEDFLPWCQRSRIIRTNPDGSMEAELTIGFKFLVESYISHVELIRPSSIKTTSSQSSIFNHLINIWEFNPGPVPGSSNVRFLVDFQFRSPFYGQMAGLFFSEVATKLVSSFSERCRLIYGPGVPIYEEMH